MRVNKKEFLVKWSHMFPLIRDEAMFPTRGTPSADLPIIMLRDAIDVIEKEPSANKERE